MISKQKLFLFSLFIVFMYFEIWFLLQQHTELDEYDDRLKRHEKQISQAHKHFIEEKQHSIMKLKEREEVMTVKENNLDRIQSLLLDKDRELQLQESKAKKDRKRLAYKEEKLRVTNETLLDKDRELQRQESKIEKGRQQYAMREEKVKIINQTLLQEKQLLQIQKSRLRGYSKQVKCLRELALRQRSRETLSYRERKQEDVEAADHWAAISSHPEVQRMIFKQQHPLDCSEAKLFILKYVDPDKCGHGCQVHYISVALTYTYITGRTLILDEQSFWFLRGDRTGDDFFKDYFRPITWCHSSDYSSSEVVALNAQGKSKNNKEEEEDEDNRVLTADILYPWMIVHYQHSIPDEFTADYDLFWWRSQLVYYILTPLPETWGIIRAARHEVCLKEFWPIIGIHSRQGSSVKLDGDGGRRKVYSSEFHMKKADQLAKQITGNSSAIAQNIFLSTEYVEEITQMENEYPDRFFIHFAGTMQDLHSVLLDTGMSATEKYKPYHELHLIAIIHLFTLIEVNGFIGQFQSNYSRLVLEMLKAIGKEVPYLSVGDHDWNVDP